jgi:hypothetical protein
MSELAWIGETAATASLAEASAAAPAGAVGGSRTRERIAWTAVVLLAGSLATTLSYFTIASRGTATDVRPITFIVSPPEGAILPRIQPTPFAVSPDGRQLAFVASRAGTDYLWVRSLESVTVRQLPDTDGAQGPFWSPDSRSLAFFRGGRLEKIVVAGGHPQTLCACGGATGDWSSDGTILFGSLLGINGGLSQVPAAGGPLTAVTKLDLAAGETLHDYPQFLPDRRHFLYVVRSAQPDHAGLYVGSLDSTTRRRILPGTSNVVYAPPGYLLFWRNGGLLAQAFNAATGNPRSRLTSATWPCNAWVPAERTATSG